MKYATMKTAENPVRTVFIAGLIAGTLDITAAFVQWAPRGVSPELVLKGIASGLLGKGAFHGGTAIAAFGLGLHFFIALGAATVFYFASRQLRFMTRRPVAAGALYGIAVYFFMYYIVIPLSHTSTRYTPALIAIAILVHIFCIGLPISLTIHHLDPSRHGHEGERSGERCHIVSARRPSLKRPSHAYKNNLMGLLFLCTAAAIPSFAVAQNSNSKEAEAVLAVESTACRAYQNGDVEAIKRYLTDDYILTNSKGEMTTKLDDLNDAATGKAKYTLFENREMKVRLFASNNAAVVTGKTFLKGTYDNKPIDLEVQFTDTLVKQDGHWRLAAGHVSRLRE